MDDSGHGGLIEKQLVSAPVSAHLYTEPERTADRVFESFYGCKMVRMYCCPCGTGWGAGDLGFDVADGPAAVGSAVCELPSAVVVGFSEECFAVALREPCCVGNYVAWPGEGRAGAWSPGTLAADRRNIVRRG